MICWFLLVPAGVPVLVSLLLTLSFPQDRGSVSSWFAGSSWFRLGFQCLSPFFSLLSFLRKGVLFHHNLLVFPGSGWGSGACLRYYSFFFGSGACLPSSLFFLSSGQGFCSIMIYWFLLVPAGLPVLVSLLLSSLVPVLVSLLLSSFFPQERGSVPSFAGSSGWGSGACRCLSPLFSFLWFRCLSPLSPFFSLFLSSGKGFCSIMNCWFFLVPAGVILSFLVPVLVSLLLSSFFPQDRGSVPSWFAGSSWFRLGFWCLSPFFSLLSFLRTGVLFHHDLLVALGSSWVPVLVSPASLFFGSGVCLPSSLFFLSSGKGFCSMMIYWFVEHSSARWKPPNSHRFVSRAAVSL